MQNSDKVCSRCNEQRCEKGFRFCFRCKSIVEREMNQSNYLTPNPSRDYYRGPGSRENMTDTRRGHK